MAPSDNRHHNDAGPSSSDRGSNGHDEAHYSSSQDNAATASESERETIIAFAKLQFADGDFFVTTQALEIGRRKDSLSPLAPATPTPQQDQVNPLEALRDVQDAIRQNGLDIEGPRDCPKLQITHAQANGTVPPAKKSISRRHARIQYNSDEGYWECLFLGRNGGFVNDIWSPQGEIVPLEDAAIIQLGPAGFQFFVPETEDSGTESDMLDGSEAASEDSMTDEDQEGLEVEEETAGNKSAPKLSLRGSGRPKSDIESNIKSIKRKGPGRPPKNGVMSKRQEAELARQTKERQEMEKKSSAAAKTNGRGRGKTAKAKALEQTSTQPSGKRKYTRRKKLSGDKGESQVDEVEPDTPAGNDKAASKATKEKKPAKVVRTPSPDLGESAYTEEQLAKPQQSYVVLIHEALSNAPNGHMALPCIYRAIMKKYPYFKYRSGTQGWQSSVRHNLGQHAAFRKIEKEGKGFSWGIDPDVSIEKEKKRRATPPPQPQPKYYPTQQSQQPRAGNFTYPTSYPNGQLPPNATFAATGYPGVNNYANHTGMQPSPLANRPPYGTPGFPLILNPHSDTYRSPYDLGSADRANDPKANNSQAASSVPQASAAQATTLPYASHRPTVHEGNMSHDGFGSPLVSMPPDLSKQLSNLSTESSARLKRFRSEFVRYIDDKTYAVNLIDNALSRTLDPTMPSRTTNPHESAKEKAIINQLTDILAKASKHSDVQPGTDVQSAQTECKQAAELAEEVTRTSPGALKVDGDEKPYEIDVNGGSPSSNGLKHKRTPTFEGMSETSARKRLASDD